MAKGHCCRHLYMQCKDHGQSSHRPRIVEFHPRQKAIIASGFSETDHVKEAQRLGAGQYIKKPYTLEVIGLAVKKELDRG